MTVTHLREVMPNQEHVEWRVYLGRKAQKQEIAAKKARH